VEAKAWEAMFEEGTAIASAAVIDRIPTQPFPAKRDVSLFLDGEFCYEGFGFGVCVRPVSSACASCCLVVSVQ
jgi:hypothetical protein